MTKKSETTILGGVGDGGKPAGGMSYAGMSYEEILANPPTNVRRKRPLTLPQPKPKAVFVEVSPRMHAAVQARPEKLKLIAEGADGVAVIEKPAAAGTARVGTLTWGALSEAEIGTAEYNRRRTKSATEGGQRRPPPLLVDADGNEVEPEPRAAVPAGTPAAAWGGGGTDQHWKPKRVDGETRFVPDARGSRADALVVSDYDIFAVLKENE